MENTPLINRKLKSGYEQLVIISDLAASLNGLGVPPDPPKMSHKCSLASRYSPTNNRKRRIPTRRKVDIVVAVGGLGKHACNKQLFSLKINSLCARAYPRVLVLQKLINKARNEQDFQQFHLSPPLHHRGKLCGLVA